MKIFGQHWLLTAPPIPPPPTLFLPLPQLEKSGAVKFWNLRQKFFGISDMVGSTASRSFNWKCIFHFSTDGAQKGVDSSESSDNALAPAKALATECGCVVVVTGEHDYVTDGLRVIVVSNGDAILKVITAAGCALTATLAALFCFFSGPKWHNTSYEE